MRIRRIMRVRSGRERGLAEQIHEVRAARWRQENGAALVSSNEYVEQNGLPLGLLRQF